MENGSTRGTGLKIVLIVEGQTEKVFLPVLRGFLQGRLSEKMPQVRTNVKHGRIPTGEKLRRLVARYLAEGHDAVVALTDVYTGTREFADAADAKSKMRQWVGPESRFHPHAAQYDFEAWLIPYWNRIQEICGTNRRAPSGKPESVNHNKPPSKRIKEVFLTGTKRDFYSKTRDAKKILEGQDLAIAAAQCPELKALLNTFLTLCGGPPL